MKSLLSRSSYAEAAELSPTVQEVSIDSLGRAIVQAVAYADVFDYPLTPWEIHRYLIGVPASLEAVQAALRNGKLVPDYLTPYEGYFTLPGREAIVEVRRRRARVAASLWPYAVHYGRIIAGLPFVRMVAVTGALAVDNVEQDADIDYLIVTEPDRLWLCRALIIGLVRLVARHGIVLCPNYLISMRALTLSEHNLFTAHELAQMVPIGGWDVYQRIRQLNAWVARFLPNANGPPRHIEKRALLHRPIGALAEVVLRTPIGARLERWEMNRKIQKLSRQIRPNNGKEIEAAFCADWCKGHFDGHGHHTLNAFAERLRKLEIGNEETIDGLTVPAQR